MNICAGVTDRMSVTCRKSLPNPTKPNTTCCPKRRFISIREERRNNFQSMADKGRAALETAEKELLQLSRISNSFTSLVALKRARPRVAVVAQTTRTPAPTPAGGPDAQATAAHRSLAVRTLTDLFSFYCETPGELPLPPDTAILHSPYRAIDFARMSPRAWASRRGVPAPRQADHRDGPARRPKFLTARR
ncbi:hypothetical protein FBZ93_111234 [Bradyrhizobium macuxiense]|uniref:Uncharacterized protein n=1 Tax=Bradyrhizobium macuxiense TaxID=1755647 RepID=A0A560LCV9_9BRAD|nr:hypothetical protein FBZ93_111234 [Bradyrhizobium macuxiense]